MSDLKIALVTAELRPYAWVGGLSDVVSSLATALAVQGHDVKVYCPLYGKIKNSTELVKIKDLEVSANKTKISFEIFKDPASENPEILFVGYDHFFNRDGIYLDPETGSEYPDNFERWNFFSLAVLKAFLEKDLTPDVVHCNDSHTGLIPCYLKMNPELYDPMNQMGTLLTIHNLGYQGKYPSWKFALTGLPETLFYPMQPLEYYGQLNMLKAGIVFGDIVSTVSHQYALEIQTESAGHGLDGVLRERSTDLFGIVNAIDTDTWNPETDPLIDCGFSLSNLKGKLQNKKSLQQFFGLPVRDIPLVGMITRLVEQKGLELFDQIRSELFALDCQFVFLGSGEKWWEDFLLNLESEAPEQFGVKIGYDNRLAHQIEAGCDLFLMPSLYEPCGLNQMYSMRYGTVPLVREIGGLADTVSPYNQKTGKGTGFVFQDFDGQSFLKVLEEAISSWKDKDTWKRIMANGMKQDFSWSNSASEYVSLYRKALEKTSNTTPT